MTLPAKSATFRHHALALSCAVLVQANIAFVPLSVYAQSTPLPPMPIPTDDLPSPPDGGAPLFPPINGMRLPPAPITGGGAGTDLPKGGALPKGLDLNVPIIPSTNGVKAPQAGPKLPKGKLVMTAKLTEDTGPLTRGVVWRIFSSKAGSDGKMPLVSEVRGGVGETQIENGVYFVYCAFGHAERVTRVETKGQATELVVVLNAGGLKLSALLGPNKPVPNDKLTFDVLSQDVDAQGDHKIITSGVRAGQLLRLMAGSYQIVARYGDVNAQAKAEIDVRAGKLTEATLNQKAAEVTLKLVEQGGGMALANTDWTVFTPSGELVTHKKGAFPSIVLAAGTYSVIAKHTDQLYTRDFTVENAVKKDVEVVTSKDKESNYFND